jgi:hemerythrin-like domain-containing protein
MKPSDILSREHRVIEQVLDCLEKMAVQGEDSGQLDEQSIAEALDFFRNFADRCHHGKEEAHFFPAMEAKGFPRASGPTGVMIHEHDLGRHRVAGMSEALAAAQAGDASGPTRFAEHARAFIVLLRGHIEKEDHCLFALANEAFTEIDQQQLLDAFTQVESEVESEEMGHGTHEKYLQIADRLADRYGVAKAHSASPPCGGCGCGHHK